MAWTEDFVLRHCPFANTPARVRRWALVATALSRRGYLTSYQIQCANEAVRRMIYKSIQRRAPEPEQLELFGR